MKADAQGILLKIPEQPVPVPLRAVAGVVPTAKPKLKPIDREQGFLRTVIVDELVAEDHKVRAIWDLTGELDLTSLYSQIRSKEGNAGSPAWNPRLLLSVWLYAYSEQVTSAREVARLMEYEPGLMWLSGLGEVNYHKLSEFRAENPEALKQWMSELLGTLSEEGIVKLACVAHDGTKIQAQGGSDSYRRGTTLEKEIAKARQMVEELEKEPESGPAENPRRKAARQRAARERSERMKQAAEQLAKVRAGKQSEKERKEARVSLTEPEARIMKHGNDGGLASSYNVQISTDAEQKIIVGIELTQSSSDSGSLQPAMEQVKETMGRYPEQVVADGFLWIAGSAGSETGSIHEGGGNRSGVWAIGISSTCGEQDSAMSGGKDPGIREAVQERRHDILAISSGNQGLPRVCIPKTVLSSTGAGAVGIDPHDGKRGGSGVPREDEGRGGAANL
jgi:transposase